jgi:hypothetical protein
MMMVRALRDICKDEEILIDYVPKFNYPQDRHQSMLQFNFECRCAWCLEDPGRDYRITKRRKRYFDSICAQIREVPIQKSQELIHELEETYPPNAQFREYLIYPLIHLGHEFTMAGRYTKAIATCQRVQTIKPRPTVFMELLTRMELLLASILSDRSDWEACVLIDQVLSLALRRASMGWPLLKPYVAHALSDTDDPESIMSLFEFYSGEALARARGS